MANNHTSQKSSSEKGDPFTRAWVSVQDVAENAFEKVAKFDDTDIAPTRTGKYMIYKVALLGSVLLIYYKQQGTPIMFVDFTMVLGFLVGFDAVFEKTAWELWKIIYGDPIEAKATIPETTIPPPTGDI